jgi:DNA polymerase/3'-5' exonuclease PolX
MKSCGNKPALDKRQTIKPFHPKKAVMKLTRKQAELFPEDEPTVLTELSLKEAEKIAEQIKTAVAAQCDKLEVAGSIRRQKPIVHDIDFVAVTKNDTEWQKISETLKHMKAKLNCSGNSVTKALIPYNNSLVKVDFYRAKPSTFGIHLLVRTGSAEHNMWLASLAISKGMRIKYSEGLIKDGNVIAGEDEKEVYEALGLPYPLPHEREIVEGKPAWTLPQKQ